jgi:hypothetical protein
MPKERIHKQRTCFISYITIFVNPEGITIWNIRWAAWRVGADCRLHPLIYTLPKFNLAQDIVAFQRFSGLGNELPHTGHTFSLRLTIIVNLHFWHFTAWTLTRLISSGSRPDIRFLRFRKVLLRWSETGKKGVRVET